MNKKKIIIAIVLPITILGLFLMFPEKPTQENNPNLLIPTMMRITSPAFKNNGKIPSRFTCDADNINPELIFSNVPADAKSLTLITHDPDAPMHGGWTHWIVINMDPRATGINENSQPATGLEATNDFGKTSFGGPCPPSGSHRYFFYLYALDSSLALDQKATKDEVEKAMTGHILEKAELVGLYKRQ